MFAALKERLFGGRGDASKAVARSRLHFVLVQDRTGLTNEEMTSFKSEMIAVIEKYFVIDKSGFDIAYKRDVETTTLLINSPVVVRRRNDKAPRTVSLKAAKEKKAEKEAASKKEEPSENHNSSDHNGTPAKVEASAEPVDETVQAAEENVETPLVAQT